VCGCLSSDFVRAKGPATAWRPLAGLIRSIKAPSVCKHIPDKRALENALVSDGFEELASGFQAATAGADDPVDAIARPIASSPVGTRASTG
jgi:hypothetical protein